MGARRLWTGALLVLLAGVAFRLWVGVGPLDDDYIVFRYAERWLERGEPTYDDGVFVEGYTVPLWLLWITAGLALGLDPAALSQGTGVLALLLLVVLCARAWWQAEGERFPFPALALAVAAPLAFHAAAGLGTVPLAALLFGWAHLWSRGRERAAAWLLGAACLLRMECLLFVPPFLAAVALGRRAAPGGRPWSALDLLVPALAPSLGWLAFRLHTYGAWLPNTFGAKRLPLLEELSYGSRYLVRTTLDSGVGLWLLGCALALGMARLGRVTRVLAGCVLLHAAYVVAVGGDYIHLARFFVPTLPLMVFVSWRVLRALVGTRPALYAGLGALLFVPVLASHARLEWMHDLYEANEGRWKAVGRELGRRLEPHQSIAIAPIGCVGYTSRRPIVDVLGLTHRGMRDVPPDLEVTLKGHHRHDATWVFAQRPTVVVPSNAQLRPNAEFLVFMWERDLLTHPTLRRDYHPLLLPVEGSYPLVAYVLRELPVPADARVLPQR